MNNNLDAWCGWVYGYAACRRDGCDFPAARCVLVSRGLSEHDIRGSQESGRITARADSTSSAPSGATCSGGGEGPVDA